MAVNFTELLDKNRLRPLWGSAQTPVTALKEEQPRRKTGIPELDEEIEREALQKAGAKQADEDLGDAPPEPQPYESPLQILDKIDYLSRVILGPQAMLLGVYMMPLRYALGRLTGQPMAPHPLQSAVRTGNLPLLIYALEDSYRGLLRTVQRFGR